MTQIEFVHTSSFVGLIHMIKTKRVPLNEIITVFYLKGTTLKFHVELLCIIYSPKYNFS